MSKSTRSADNADTAKRKVTEQFAAINCTQGTLVVAVQNGFCTAIDSLKIGFIRVKQASKIATKGNRNRSVCRE